VFCTSSHSKPQDRFAKETPAQQARHREIELRYRRRKIKGSPKVHYRLRDLEVLYTDRFGERQLPNDPDGYDALFVMANHLAFQNGPVRRIMSWVRQWAPWHSQEETERLIDQVLDRTVTWKADALADRLRVDYDTRMRLKIRTIGATDKKKRARTLLRKKRAAERHRIRRAKIGTKPRKISIEQRTPWIDLGISRSTYFRNRRNLANETVRLVSSASSTPTG
jgi:hypothetical protein